MIALIQRVLEARVEVAGECIGAIDQGLLVFVCAEPGDTEALVEKLTAKLMALRVFANEEGRMAHTLADVQGGLLLVSQFTLAADLSRGARPSFSGAAPAEQGRHLFERLVAVAQSRWPNVKSGRFGADMRVHLVNDGPVTLCLNLRS